MGQCVCGNIAHVTVHLIPRAYRGMETRSQSGGATLNLRRTLSGFSCNAPCLTKWWNSMSSLHSLYYYIYVMNTAVLEQVSALMTRWRAALRTHRMQMSR